MKELENAIGWINKADGGRLPQYKMAYLEKARRLIKQELHTPTAKEICNMLSAYLKYKVYYVGERFCTEDDIILIGITPLDNLVIKIILPPHIITAIGKFYEYEKEWNNE